MSIAREWIASTVKKIITEMISSGELQISAQTRLRRQMDQALLQMTSPSSVALWECSGPRGEHMSNKRFGYARVSTTDQNEDRQVLELLESGIEERDIYVDKQSGRSFERTNYLAPAQHHLAKRRCVSCQKHRPLRSQLLCHPRGMGVSHKDSWC